MKYQDLFSLENKKKIFQISSAAVVIGASRIKNRSLDATGNKKRLLQIA